MVTAPSRIPELLSVTLGAYPPRAHSGGTCMQGASFALTATTFPARPLAAPTCNRMVDEHSIKREVFGRVETVNMAEEWLTPAGNARSAPVYSATIYNTFLRKERTIRTSDPAALERKARAQLQTWAEQEARCKIRDATREAQETARDNAEQADEDAQAESAAIQGILAATLNVDDRIDWEQLVDKTRFGEFSYAPAKPQPPLKWPAPILPPKPLWSWLFPCLTTNWRSSCDAIIERHTEEAKFEESAYRRAVLDWTRSREVAQHAFETDKAASIEKQRRHNEAVVAFRERFEAAEASAVEEYIRNVFERSSYPDGFPVMHQVAFDSAAQTVVVDLTLPAHESVSDVVGYKLTKGQAPTPLRMKGKDHEAFYEEAIRQTVLRTVHEVLECDYVGCIQRFVVNGWVNRVDPATGHDIRPCIISVSTSRSEFQAINLARVNCSDTLRRLKALTAGPLSQTAPVQPIFSLIATMRDSSHPSRSWARWPPSRTLPKCHGRTSNTSFGRCSARCSPATAPKCASHRPAATWEWMRSRSTLIQSVVENS